MLYLTIILKKSTSHHCASCQAEYDAMLQEFAGEGIPLLASSVPADNFAPFLNDLLPLIMSKAVSLNLLTELLYRTFHTTGYTDKNTRGFCKRLQSLWSRNGTNLLIFSHI